MNELSFLVNAPFESVSFDEIADNWIFRFADKISVHSSGFWRALKSEKIVIVSLDHGHQFGLPNALNLVDELTFLLKGEILSEMRIYDHTGDLTLILTSNYKIEMFIASANYETYQFSVQGKTYIGLGSGEIASFTDH
jgi:hypothetical protein